MLGRQIAPDRILRGRDGLDQRVRDLAIEGKLPPRHERARSPVAGCRYPIATMLCTLRHAVIVACGPAGASDAHGSMLREVCLRYPLVGQHFATGTARDDAAAFEHIGAIRD